MFTESFKGVSRKFKGCFNEVSKKFSGNFKGVQESLKDASTKIEEVSK